MAGPAELINQRYGDVFLSKSRNLKIVSREAGNQVPVQFTEYNALLSTGALNPVVVTALVQGAGPAEGGLLQELNWSSVHVRSYRSWDEVVSAGINLVDTEPQKPMVMSGRQGKDLNIRAQAETENSKVYHFESQGMGKITLFTSKPTITTGGNDLPRKTTLLPMLAEHNFVYER